MNDRDRDYSRRDPSQGDGGDAINYLRMAASILLLAFGIGTAIWLLVSIANVISSEQPPSIVTAIAPPSAKPVELRVGGNLVELPRQVLVAPAYFVLCFLYVIAASITKTIISAGVTLLQPDFKEALARLERIQKKQ